MDLEETDLRIDTYRQSPGGQHTNGTYNCVRICHIPTGLMARCDTERSFHKNKLKAIEELKEKIHEYFSNL